MEIVALIFAGVSAVAAVFSLIMAFAAKSEVKKLKLQINSNSERSVGDSNKIKIGNSGENSGVMTGIITGDVNEKREN